MSPHLLSLLLVIAPVMPAVASSSISTSPPAQSIQTAQVPAGFVRPPMSEEDLQAARAFDRWRDDPLGFVRKHFQAEPDKWQRDVLEMLLVSPRIAMSACKGPGKSTVLCWCAWWILACHVDATGYALSITAENLKDNLWKEMSIWYDLSPVLQLMFEVGKKRISSRSRPDTWFLSARSFPQSADATQQANTLAGLHGKVVFILLDEVGDMTSGVVSSAKGIFLTKGQKAWLLAAGNPTTQDGALYWITDTDAAQWEVIHISGDPLDPNRSPRIDKKVAAAEIIALGGRDNPWVMTNILGLFPPQGSNQLIAVNDVTLAMARNPDEMAFLDQSIVWGLDPAYSDKSGADEACLMRRQGICAFAPHYWRGANGTVLGDSIAFMIKEARREGRGPDKIFVDKGGVGVSAFDRLNHLGYGTLIVGVDFGGAAAKQDRYRDKRTEMWVLMSEWLPQASLPKDPVLRGELPSPRYEFRRTGKSTKFCLETKQEMKDRGKRSPNRGDALALTFAAPVPARTALDRAREAQGLGHNRVETTTAMELIEPDRHSRPTMVQTDYDPFRRGPV